MAMSLRARPPEKAPDAVLLRSSRGESLGSTSGAASLPGDRPRFTPCKVTGPCLKSSSKDWSGPSTQMLLAPGAFQISPDKFRSAEPLRYRFRVSLASEHIESARWSGSEEVGSAPGVFVALALGPLGAVWGSTGAVGWPPGAALRRYNGGLSEQGCSWYNEGR